MTLTRRPVPLGPSPWDRLRTTDDATNSPVAIGGKLTSTALVGAYRRGIFPWPADDLQAAADLHCRFATAVADGRIPNLTPGDPAPLDLPWWSPDPRGVLPVSELHVSRSLRSRLRSCNWTTTVDRAFDEVVCRCRRGGPDAWITAELVDAYTKLHTLGWAHSIEVWAGDELVGGMYGILVGGICIGESMFHARTDASKVALVDFVARFAAAGGVLLDVQFATPHLRSMGAVELPRKRFLAILHEVRDKDLRLIADRLPVARLARSQGAAAG